MNQVEIGASVAMLRTELQAVQESILEQPDLTLSDQALLHRDAVYLALDLGDTATAMTHALKCLDLARICNDPPLYSKAYVALGLVQAELYDDLGADAHFQVADALSREAQDHRGVALVAVNASHIDLNRRRYSAALTRLHTLLVSPHAVGLDEGESPELRQTFHINYVLSAAWTLTAEAQSDVTSGPLREEIEKHLSRSVGLIQKLNADRTQATNPLMPLGVLEALVQHAVWQRDLSLGLKLADEYVHLACATGVPLILGRALLDRSRVHLHERQWEEAIADARQAVQAFGEACQDVWLARGSELLADAYAHAGRFEEAFEAQREVTRRIEALYREFYQQRALVTQVEQQAREAEVRATAFAEAALCDPLTGAPNRTHAMQVLNELHLQAKAGRGSAVALLDLDHFKSVNDTHGHAVGDTVLTRVAQTLAASCREGDTVARYGGEEFVVVLKGADLTVARETCERLRIALADLEWSATAPELKITASLGVALIDGHTDLKVTLKAADDALYDAKADGRNTVKVYEGRAERLKETGSVPA
ncbi:GGDEF domain-containing protein (plasmid) [Deinococcus radiomollis]|uniref:GGDEF domain-containing protein n=1 Tax=Deinococcus radiomollis TaxID=468916 RepID=UPI00389296F6